MKNTLDVIQIILNIAAIILNVALIATILKHWHSQDDSTSGDEKIDNEP